MSTPASGCSSGEASAAGNVGGKASAKGGANLLLHQRVLLFGTRSWYVQRWSVGRHGGYLCRVQCRPFAERTQRRPPTGLGGQVAAAGAAIVPSAPIAERAGLEPPFHLLGGYLACSIGDVES
jgi:hypothetical protein